MGRYAVFNTGVEYKFAFAVQESSDITMFGGRPGDTPLTWSWIAERDLLKVKAATEYLQSLLHLSKGIDIEAYEKSARGTDTLISSGDDTIFKEQCGFLEHGQLAYLGEGQLAYRYLIGCVIYHQLLYQPQLEVHYEA